MTVGNRIKELRKKLHLSQVAFADMINVSKQTLYKYENDIITNIPSDKIESIAKICNVSPAHLMGWEEADEGGSYVPSATIKALRIKKGFSQENLAEKLNIPLYVYTAYENNVYNFTDETIIKIFEFLGEVPEEYLIHNGNIYMMLVGGRIKKVREDHGLSIVELSRKTEIPENIIEAFENQTLYPSQNDLDIIAVVLKTSSDYLLGFPNCCLPNERKTMLTLELKANELERNLFNEFNKLNSLGKKVAIERVQELSELPKYTTNIDD